MKYGINCPRQCSLGEANIGKERALLVRDWFEAGHKAFTVNKLCRENGIKTSETAVYNHFKRHMTLLDDGQILDVAAAEAINDPAKRLSDLEILERIIQKGAAALARKDARVTPEMTMKALDLKLKLTQGSVFDAFLGAVADAMGDEPASSEELEDPDA